MYIYACLYVCIACLFYDVVILLSELLQAGYSNGRKSEEEIIGFAIMKHTGCERTSGRPHRSIQ